MSQIDPSTLNDVPVVKASEVIKKRQVVLVSQVFDLDERINQLEVQRKQIEKEIEALKLEKAELTMEYDILEKFDDRGLIKVTSSTTTTTTVEFSRGRKFQPEDRIGFEDALTAIMKEAGRPLQFGDIRNRLENYGYRWSKYGAANAYIRNFGLLENAGKKGFYQLIRR